MADGDDHPVASLNALSHIRPKTVVEGTAAHTSERLVFYRNLVGIEELVLVVSPAPLAVVTITQRAIAHRRVTYQEEYRIIALATGSRLDSGGHRLVQAIHGIVDNLIDIFHRLCHLGKGSCSCRHQ